MIAVVSGRAGGLRMQVEAALRGAGVRAVGAHPSPALAVLLEDAAHPPWPDVPTIVISSKTDIDSFTNALTSGAAAYLTTPLDTGELIAAARRLARWKAPAPGTSTRTRSRRPLLLDVDLEIEGRRLRGHLVDVSAGGCRVETAGRVSRGAAVRLTPRALGTSTGIALGATVTRTRRDETARPPLCEVALRFTGTSALLAARIFGAPGADRRQALRFFP
jgi:PilZ domain-containing protein